MLWKFEFVFDNQFEIIIINLQNKHGSGYFDFVNFIKLFAIVQTSKLI